MDQNTAISALSPALHYAVGKRNLKLARELLKAGADVNHKSKVGNPNDYQYDCTPMIVAALNDDLRMVKVLLKYKPNVNDEEINGGDLPLTIAARGGQLEMLKTLVAYPGTKVTAGDHECDFALVIAAETGNYNMVELLINDGRHSKDNYSRAVEYAASHGQTDVMRLLLEQGADANILDINDDGYTPLYSVLQRGNWDNARLLLRYGAIPEAPFKQFISYDGQAMRWLAEDTSRTILSFKGSPRLLSELGLVPHVSSNWDGIVAALWFHYFGPTRAGDPPCIRNNTSRLSDEDFKIKYKWMVHAVSTLLFLKEGNMLLPHLCRVFDPCVALELCSHAGKTPLLLALEMFPRRNETKRQNLAKGANVLIEWNPGSLKVPDPGTRRIPMTCAIVKRAPLETLQKMISCKNESWFTAAPKQQDPVTLLPNFLLVAAGKDCYSVSDIYAFSRDFLPDRISSLTSRAGLRRSRRGTKRRRGQI